MIQNISDAIYIFLRKKVLRLSQEEFGEITCLSKDTISNIERGKYLPNLATLIRISNAAEISVEFFLRELER